MPLPSQSPQSVIPDRLPTPPTLGLVQLDITLHTKRVFPMNNEILRLIILLPSFTLDEFRARRRGFRGIEEWVAAFAAEEVELVVGALAESGVVDGDEAVVDDGGFAVVAFGCELLTRKTISLGSTSFHQTV